MPKPDREVIYSGVIVSHGERIEQAIEAERGCHRLRPLMEADNFEVHLRALHAGVVDLSAEEQRAIMATCYHELNLVVLACLVDARFRVFQERHRG